MYSTCYPQCKIYYIDRLHVVASIGIYCIFHIEAFKWHIHKPVDYSLPNNWLEVSGIYDLIQQCRVYHNSWIPPFSATQKYQITSISHLHFNGFWVRFAFYSNFGSCWLMLPKTNVCLVVIRMSFVAVIAAVAVPI